MINKLKANLEELKGLEDIADKMEAEYEADPLNKEKDAAEHKAYTDSWNKFMEVANQIHEITDGKIGLKTARQMLRDKRSEIVDIVEKYTERTQDFNINQDKIEASDRSKDASKQEKKNNPVRHNINLGVNR